MGDASDEVTDIAGSGELGHGVAIGKLTDHPDDGFRFPFLQGGAHCVGERRLADRDREVGRGIDSGVPGYLSNDSAGRLGLWQAVVVDLSEGVQ